MISTQRLNRCLTGRKPLLVFAFLSVTFIACQFTPYPQDVYNQSNSNETGESPSDGSADIYSASDLTDLCVDHEICGPPYGEIPSPFVKTSGQEPLDSDNCNYDYNPALNSTFVVRRVDGPVNGLRLLFSGEDLFFLAWVSIRYKINPYFLMGVLSQESRGNCSAVSASHAEGCFQVTNTFGQAQLNESYPLRTSSWFWTDRSGSYYPDNLFVDEELYFGEAPPSEQFRITKDPFSNVIDGTDISSVVNFHFGIIASALYFHWQQYLLYYHFDELRDVASALFQDIDGKALWQAAAYNGGAFGASWALGSAGENFLDEMAGETAEYAPLVVDYCKGYESGELAYEARYTENDLLWIIDLLASTYPAGSGINWGNVKDDVHQVFFAEEGTELEFVDDIKAVVYVISTHVTELAPEWPDEDSI